jgi:hypothetical protein
LLLLKDGSVNWSIINLVNKRHLQLAWQYENGQRRKALLAEANYAPEQNTRVVEERKARVKLFILKKSVAK